MRKEKVRTSKNRQLICLKIVFLGFVFVNPNSQQFASTSPSGQGLV